MAEKTLNTRILLKYDTFSNWTTKNPVLKAGEVAIATIASGNTEEVNSVTAPQVLIKVGDGTSAYNVLPFASAKAADVYSWAKAEKKPTYEANEITGIDAYIEDYVKDEMGISLDTDTQYQMVKVDNYTYKLQSKGKTDSAWSDVANGTITIPQDDTDTQYQIIKGNNDYTYKLQSKGLTDSTWTDVSTFTVPEDDTNTQYSFSLDGYVLTVKKKDISDADFVEYQTINLTSAFNAKADKVTGATAGNFAGLDVNGNLTDSGKKASDFATATQGALADTALQKADITSGSANGTIAVEGTDVAVKGLGSAAYTEASAYAEAEHPHVAADITDFATEVAKVKVNNATNADSATKATQDGNGDVISSTYSKVGHDHTHDDINDFDTAVAAIKVTNAANADNATNATNATKATRDAAGNVIADTYETKSNASDKYAELGEADAEISRQIEDINGSISELSEVALTSDELNSVKKWVEFDAEGNVPVDEDTFNVLNGKVATLIGSDANKSVRKIANEELAAQLIAADADASLDTLTEIAAWIQEHPDDAATMNAAITAIQEQLAGIAAGDGTVKKYVDDAIAALKIGDYAKAADLAALANRVHDTETALDILNSDEETDGSIACTVAEAIGTAMGDLAAIATTGNVNDLVQTTGDVLIFDCGNADIPTE